MFEAFTVFTIIFIIIGLYFAFSLLQIRSRINAKFLKEYKNITQSGEIEFKCETGTTKNGIRLCEPLTSDKRLPVKNYFMRNN